MITTEFHGLIGYFTFALGKSPVIVRCAGASGRGEIDGKGQVGKALASTAKRSEPPSCRFIQSFKESGSRLRTGRGACFAS